jgi:hypothetical protein
MIMSDANGSKDYLTDPPLIFLILLLVAVLVLFFRGVVDYPLGWLVIMALIFLRINHIRKTKRKL